MTDADLFPLVFISYPQEFACYEKFRRKVGRILGNIASYSVAYVEDPRTFVDRLASEDARCRNIEQRAIAALEDRITHAIFFNESGLFDELVAKSQAHDIKTRVIPLSLTKVVNIDKGEELDVYIGRGSTWGNPYAIGFDGDRDEVIRKFSYDFDRGFLKFTKDEVLSLKGKRLGCHCKPSACHGDVLAAFANSFDDGA